MILSRIVAIWLWWILALGLRDVNAQDNRGEGSVSSANANGTPGEKNGKFGNGKNGGGRRFGHKPVGSERVVSTIAECSSRASTKAGVLGMEGTAVSKERVKMRRMAQTTTADKKTQGGLCLPLRLRYFPQM